ncbi:hypothetical protein J4227_04995 [Candidatus Woesearchaeota archaeon]|nr:hypothetical protein [Candidatus Woesearchaeota archaeon]
MVKKLSIENALEPFLGRPGESIHLASVAREINQPYPTVRLWLNELAARGILGKKFVGRLTTYHLNLGHPNLIDYLLVAEQRRLIRKCTDDLLMREAVKLLRQALPENAPIVIFGSATVSFKKANDVDLLVAAKIKEPSINEISGTINKKIHLINVTSLDGVSRPLKGEIVKHHAIINGHYGVLRWMLS